MKNLAQNLYEQTSHKAPASLRFFTPHTQMTYHWTVTPLSRFLLTILITLLTTTNRNPSRAAIQLQKQIDLAMAWFQKWKLKVNAQKSVAVMFNRPRGFNDFKPQINGLTIEWSTSSKYLGLTIDQDLKFKNISISSQREQQQLEVSH